MTNTTQVFETITTSVALKSLKCRIGEAISRVFYQLIFVGAGEYPNV